MSNTLTDQLKVSTDNNRSDPSVQNDADAVRRRVRSDYARVAPKDESREFIRDWTPGRGVEDYVVSATIEAVKPLP